MAGPCMIEAAAELGFTEMGKGQPASGGHSVILTHPLFRFGVTGVGKTLKEARRTAAEKAYSRYWSSRLATDAALAKAFAGDPS